MLCFIGLYIYISYHLLVMQYYHRDGDTCAFRYKIDKLIILLIGKKLELVNKKVSRGTKVLE